MKTNLDLNELRLFLEVAKLKSITLAANSTGEQKSKISRKIQNLESNLQTRLFHRKPGSMELSEQGKQLFEVYQPIFLQLDNAQSNIISSQQALQGVVSLSMPLNLSVTDFNDILFSFKQIYQDIHLHCSTFNVHPNVPQSENDVMFLLDYTPLPDHFYIAKKLMSMPVSIFCSKQYQASLPKIIKAQDIEKLETITCDGINGFSFVDNDSDIFIKANSKVLVDGFVAQKHAALKHLGLFSAPSFLMAKEIEDGELVELKFDMEIKPMSLFLAYKEKGYKTHAVQVFIDYVLDQFQYKNEIMQDQ